MDLTFGIGAKLLSGGKPNQIIERVKKYATEGMKINNFSLYLCNISKDTPEDNIYSAVNAVRELIKN
jgi:uroporphyrinogen-III decarboxylase